MATKKRPRAEEEPTEGYPEEIFLDLDGDEEQNYQCNICLQIVRQPVFCENIHFFCSSCLKRWKDTPRNLDFDEDAPPGTDCPVCRAIGTFTEDDEMAILIGSKAVVCLEKKCDWTGDLASYDEHVRIKHKLREPSSRRLRSSSSTTGRVTYHY